MKLSKLAIAVMLLSASHWVAAAPAPVVDCASLEACLKLMAQPADPPATWPYPISGYDDALIKKVLPYGAKAIPGLLALLKDPHLDVKERAGSALEDIQGLTPADLPALVQAARGGNDAVPGAIGLIGTPEAIEALLDLVKANPLDAQESQISWGLQRMGSKSLPYLLRELRCKGSCNREYLDAIERIMAEMPKDVRPDATALAAIVADKSLSDYSRQDALLAIDDFKLHDAATAKAVVQAAAEPGLREQAVQTLVRMQSKEAVHYLVAELHQARGSGASDVLYDIAMLGDAGHDAGIDVFPYLQDPDWDVRVEAAAALGNIGYREAIPRLMQALQGPDWRVSYEAVRSLGMMHAKEARAALQDTASHHWFRPVRAEAERALSAVDTGDAMAPGERNPFRPDSSDDLLIYVDGLSDDAEKDDCRSARVRWQGGEVAIDGIATWPAQHEAPNFALPDYATGVMAVQGGWLVGRDKGEFGGGLYAYDSAGNRTEVMGPLDENIRGIYKVDGTVLAVGGLAHMILDHGRVYRLDKGSDGAWKVTPLVELPGAPIKVGTLDESHLAIKAIGGVVSVDAEGQIAALECLP